MNRRLNIEDRKYKTEIRKRAEARFKAGVRNRIIVGKEGRGVLKAQMIEPLHVGLSRRALKDGAEIHRMKARLLGKRGKVNGLSEMHFKIKKRALDTRKLLGVLFGRGAFGKEMHQIFKKRVAVISAVLALVFEQSCR